MPARYVILHHQLRDEEHWDLMLEHGQALLTWQLLREPLDAGSLPIPANRIGNHRKAYLEYEGPVSGDRGVVRRIDEGTLEIETLSETYCRFVAAGRRLRGRFGLTKQAGHWVLSLADD